MCERKTFRRPKLHRVEIVFNFRHLPSPPSPSRTYKWEVLPKCFSIFVCKTNISIIIELHASPRRTQTSTPGQSLNVFFSFFFGGVDPSSQHFHPTAHQPHRARAESLAPERSARRVIFVYGRRALFERTRAAQVLRGAVK